MLVLSRKRGEKVVVVLDQLTLQVLVDTCPADGHQIEITTLGIHGDKSRSGFDGPKCIAIHRAEVFNAIKRSLSSADQSQSGCVEGEANAVGAKDAG